MPLLRTTRAAAALTSLAAIACGVAPAAHAAKITETTYDVTVEAKVTYGHQWHRAGADDRSYDRETVDTVTTVKTKIEDVLFRDGKIVNPGQWNLGDVDMTGAGQRARRYAVAQDKYVTEEHACTADGHSVLGRTILDENPDGLEPLGRGERLTVRVAEGLRLSMPCDDGQTLDVDLGDVTPFGQGLLDADFDLPGEAIGQGTIIQLIHATPAQEAAERCPGRNDATTRCAYSWEGTVRFDRTAQNVFGDTPPQADPPLAPLVPQKPAPKPPVTDEDDLLAPLVPVKSASLKGSTLRFRAACPSGCAGTLSVVGIGAKAAAAKPRGKAASVAFTVKPGAKAKTISVKLGAKLRAALRKAKRPAVRLTLKPKGGKPVSRTLTVARAK